MLYASETEATENVLALEEKSFRPDTKATVNRCVPWPLSVKQAAKITIAQCKCATFQIIIYPGEEKNFGTSSILAWGKSRVGLPPHLLLLLEHYKVHLWTGEWYFNIFIRNGFSNEKTDID